MADNRLQVQIGADTSGLTKGLQTAEGSVKKFGNAATQSTGGVNKLGAATKGAVPTLTSFSQVIQDAPYGIRGVANNITQLTSQFGYLSKSAGGSGAALKAMLGTLAGPAGILLAVSAVTSLLVAYGDKLGGAANKTNELVEATKSLIGSAQSEISLLTSLVGIAQSDVESKENKSKAIAKINEKYGKYLPNLTTENIKSSEVTKAVDLLTEAYIRQAKIKGLQSRISELYAKRYEAESKSLSSQVGFLGKLWIGLKTARTGNSLLAQTTAVTNKGLENQAETIGKVDEEIKGLNTTLTNLLSEDLSLDGIFTSTKTDSKIKEFAGKLGESLEFVKESIKPSIQGIQDTITFINPLKLSEEDAKLIAHFENMRDLMGNFEEELGGLLEGGIMNTFASFGEALVSGGGAILDNLGKFLGDLGGMLIKYGTLAVLKGKLDLAIKKGGKFAIAAGVAAIAVGIALKAAGAAIGNRASSGSSSDSSSVAGGGSSFEGSRVRTSGGGEGGGTVVFEIAGTKLVGVLSKTLSRNSALGGNLSLSYGS